ncbi:APC family permease [Exiguobacterium sp. TDN 0502]|uniref:APC family permease n=1 Tax=Exiguobacterium sp. TDN 0502 TaxID=3420731 RepID=UPI003D76B0E8
MADYKKDSISLRGAVGLGTSVMISAGIFALLGQVANLSGSWLPYIFIIGGIVTGFSSYSYIKLSNAFPSAGGIGMFLVKAYGKGTIAAAAALLMAISMIINQSLVARTFGTYLLQLVPGQQSNFWIPALGVVLLVGAFIVNISGNSFIQTFSLITSALKIGALVLFGILILSIGGFELDGPKVTAEGPITNYVAAVALTILSFKGFTTITNSGSEIKNPKRNVGVAIMLSIVISLIVYLLLAFAVLSTLSLDQIIQAKDYVLAEAARPLLGDKGVWFTVSIAILATISGIIASVFAVSRMLAMLTDMHMIPHRHFGMPGSVQKHTLVYTIVLAMLLTVFFDLSRIASMGAILYLVMDIIIHVGVLKHLRKKLHVRVWVVTLAIIFDSIVLLAFLYLKGTTDPLILVVSLVSIVVIFIGEFYFITHTDQTDESS